MATGFRRKTDPVVPQDLIDAIMHRHRPRGWRVRQSRRKTAEADRDDVHETGERRVIRVPHVRCLFTLLVYLHECGHVHRGHWSDRADLPAHVEEWEAEIYALHSAAAEGLTVPRWMVRSGQKYVLSHLHKDADNGISADPRVLKWIAS